MKTEDQIHDPKRLEALRETGLLETSRAPLLDQVTRMAIRLLHVRAAMVTLITEDRQIILSSAGINGSPSRRQTPLSQSMCRHLIVDDAPLLVADARRDERWRGIGAVSRGELTAYAGMPLHSPEGRPLGALCVIDDHSHSWRHDELETLEDLASMAEAEIASRSAERRARQELEEERTFLSALLDSLDVPVAACDAEGRIARFNTPMREALQTEETLADKSQWARVYQLFHPDGKHLLAVDELPLVRAMRERFTGQEVVVRTPGRPPRRFLVNGHPLTAPGGRNLGAVTAAHDVTVQRRVELRRSIRHAVTQALADAGSAEQAAHGVIGAITGTLGWTCGEYWQIAPGETRITRAGSWVRPGRKLPDFTGEDPMTLRSGQGLPGRVQDSGRPLWIRDLRAEPEVMVRLEEALGSGLRTAVGLPVHSGERVLAVLTFFSDTVEEPDDELLDLLGDVCAHVGRYMERRRAEDLALALTASRRRFDQVVSQVDDLVWTIEIDDDRVRVLYLSGNTTGIFGGQLPQSFDAVTFVEEHVHPDDRQDYADMHAVMRTGRPARAEYRLTGLDGVTRWVWSRTVPYRENGRLFADGVSTDITERRKLQEDHERLLAREREQVRRLRELDRMKDELVAVVSHELRSPVAVVRNYAELLLDDPGLDDAQRVFADVIDRKSTHLQHLVDGLLDLARLDAGHVGIDPRPLSLTRLVNQAVDEHRAAAEARHLSVVTELDRHLPVHGDPMRLRQVLDNLLSNAIKYTPDGGTVTVTAGCDGESTGNGACRKGDGRKGDGRKGDGRKGDGRKGTVVLTVADTGIGIPAEQYPRLFDRFFRASTAVDSGIKGTGLGLAITKSIVEAHGGGIVAAPREGGGTVFTVRLPVDPSAPH